MLSAFAYQNRCQLFCEIPLPFMVSVRGSVPVSISESNTERTVDGGKVCLMIEPRMLAQLISTLRTHMYSSTDSSALKVNCRVCRAQHCMSSFGRHRHHSVGIVIIIDCSPALSTYDYLVDTVTFRRREGGCVFVVINMKINCFQICFALLPEPCLPRLSTRKHEARDHDGRRGHQVRNNKTPNQCRNYRTWVTRYSRFREGQPRLLGIHIK
ncbi:hypothetical protein F5Y15DRAFT_383282 [Xylariaceae sp. FL0016]|nr:hypothetical protein F5Y15DRAFT_383282 [Xylariaceae sp. FL0016]